jgi:hypothetical protein
MNVKFNGEWIIGLSRFFIGILLCNKKAFQDAVGIRYGSQLCSRADRYGEMAGKMMVVC